MDTSSASRSDLSGYLLNYLRRTSYPGPSVAHRQAVDAVITRSMKNSSRALPTHSLTVLRNEGNGWGQEEEGKGDCLTATGDIWGIKCDFFF